MDGEEGGRFLRLRAMAELTTQTIGFPGMAESLFCTLLPSSMVSPLCGSEHQPHDWLCKYLTIHRHRPVCQLLKKDSLLVKELLASLCLQPRSPGHQGDQ